MSKEIYISSTPHETRLAIVEDEALTEIYYERENEYTLAGSIYNGRVTRVLPGMQSSFVDIGLERDAFLYITDFMEETPDPEEFDTASTGDRPPRTIQGERADTGAARSESSGRSSERTDRGGRGRRGGRDRDRNQDRGPMDRGPVDRAPSSEAPRSAEPAEPIEPGFAPGDAGDPAEVGEGAPGADTNRRWRGRRGRRRGRGASGQPGDPAQQNAAQADADATAPSEDSSGFEPESYHEFDGAAETRGATADRTDDTPRSDRGRRDEGRNGPRREGQRTDSPRRDQGARPPRVPRGFAPSRELYGVDSGDASTGPIANAYGDADPTAEPIILPGESLSKYRKGEEPTASTGSSAPTRIPAPATTVTLAPSANLYTIAEGWDGGATLPGETLSRRRPAESSSESRRPQRDPNRDSDRDSRRDSRPIRDARSETRRDNRSGVRNHAPAAQQSTARAEQQAVPSHEAPAAEIVAAVEASVVSAPEPVAHVVAEYEPSGASASHRVDPIAPIEYRQSAPVLDPPVESSKPAAGPAAVAHDITAIAATGEMHSEPVEVLPEATQHPAPIETPEPASPILHQGAVVSSLTGAESIAPPAGGFAPGSGQLDEEILDDEDSDATTLHASSIEEMDDTEEETLEGTADLGTMLREMSIDQITRIAPEMDEEDDLDEDDLEEDDLDEDDEEEGEDDEDDADEAGASDEHTGEQAARTGSAADAGFFEQQFGQSGEENRSGEQSAAAPSPRLQSRLWPRIGPPRRASRRTPWPAWRP
jgi:ribonuclease E